MVWLCDANVLVYTSAYWLCCFMNFPWANKYFNFLCGYVGQTICAFECTVTQHFHHWFQTRIRCIPHFMILFTFHMGFLSFKFSKFFILLVLTHRLELYFQFSAVYLSVFDINYVNFLWWNNCQWKKNGRNSISTC